MKFTNKAVIKAFEESGLIWLMDRAEDIKDDEINGQSDAEIAWETVDYHLYWYKEKDADEWHELRSARKLLKETDDGKRIPIIAWTWEIKEGYRPSDIKHAREVIKEYESMKKLEAVLYRIVQKEQKERRTS